MSGTNRYTKIETPKLNSSDYGNNLNNQFNNINNNFERLSTSEFLRGSAGDSVELYKITFDTIKKHITKTDLTPKDKIDNTIGWLLTNNIKLQILADTGLFNIDENSDNIIISDIYVICKKDILNQKIDSKSDNDIVNLIKDIYISPIYIFNTKINIDAKSNNATAYNDFTCVCMYSIKQYKEDSIVHKKLVFDISSSKNLISNSAYYDSDQGCICWRINGYNTGISIQGPRGNDGKTGKLLIGTYKNIGEDDYTSNIYIINDFNDSAEDLTNNSIVLTEENGYKTYIANLEKIENTNKYKAKIQSTQDITKLFDKNGLIIPFASAPQDFSKAFTITAKEDDNNHMLSFSSNAKTDENDSKSKQITFDGVKVIANNGASANKFWAAQLDVGNENSKNNIVSIYNGLSLRDKQDKDIVGSTLTANNNGFYVNVNSDDNDDTRANKKIVITSELDTVENNFNEKLKNYYNGGERDIIKLINSNTSTIKEYTQNSIINGTVIDKTSYETKRTNKELENHHLYFIYDQQ